MLLGDDELLDLFRLKSARTLARWRATGKLGGIRTDPSGSGRRLTPRLEAVELLVRMSQGV